jgi:hypothetical protein
MPGMEEALEQNIRRVAAEQWPGCVVDIDDDDRLRITNKHGRVISNNAPPPGWQNALDNDDKIRAFIRNVCN